MFSLIGQLNGRATLWLAHIAAFFLALIAVVTFSDVVARYVFNAPFNFSVELTELSMGLIVYLSVGLTTHEDGHISVDVVTLRLPDRIRALLSLVTNALALAFLAFLVWRVWLQAQTLIIKGDVTAVRGWPIWPVAVAMAVGSLFFLTGVFVHLIDAFARLTGRERPLPPEPTAKPYTD